MSSRRYNTANFSAVIKLLGIITFLLFLSASSYGQNTKGDRAEVGSNNQRQNRFKPSKQKRNKPKPGNHRITPHKFSVANIARSLGIGQRPPRNVYSQHDRRYVNNKHQKPNNVQKAWKGSFSEPAPMGQKPTGKSRNIYSMRGSYFKNHNARPSDKQRAWRATSSGSRPVIRNSSTKKSPNIYPQSAQYISNSHRKPRDTQKVWKGTSSSSRRVAMNNKASESRNVYPKYAQYTSNPSPKPKDVRQPPGRKRKVVPRSASSSFIRHRTINSNAGFWNVKKKSEVAVTTDIAGRPLRTKNYHTPTVVLTNPTTRHFSKRKRIGDRPSSGGARYATATRTSPKAWRGDIAGRKIRGRNFTSKSRVEGIPTLPFKKFRAGRGDKVYKGIIPGRGYKSVTRSSEKKGGLSGLPSRTPGIGADGIGNFQGNIKGHRPLKGGGSRGGLWNNKGNAILGRQPKSGMEIGTFQGNLRGSRPAKGGGSRSGRLWNNGESAILGRQPKSGTEIGNFQGNLKGTRPVKGGGSRSGRLWNNGGSAILGRQPKSGMEIGTFQGNLKGSRPVKGGGSRSGRLWNNGESAILGRQPKSGMEIGTFQGNIKSYKPFKGGGSLSGRLWNNKGVAIQGKQPGLAAQGDWTFHGNLKARPFKGGGSRSGKLWNNKGVAIQGKQPGLAAQGDWTFHGNLKTRRPLKGGGSVSGKLINNGGRPILVRIPPLGAARVGGFSKTEFEQKPNFRDQGEEFTGYTKLSRFKRAYIKNENAADESIKKRRPNKINTYSVDDLQVRLNTRKYIENKNSNEDALRKLAPSKSTMAVDGLQMKVERRAYVKNKNSSQNSLLKLAPTGSTLATGDQHVKVRQFNYVHNSSAARESLNVREPGKAFAKTTDYQGNIRMKKLDFAKLFSQKYHELHPDAKFVKINKNNVAEERDLLTTIKLWWARTFRKNDTQPDHLKEREHKPRYDKGEQGLWNE